MSGTGFDNIRTANHAKGTLLTSTMEGKMFSRKFFAVLALIPALAAFAVQPSDYAKKLTMTVNPERYGSGLAAVSGLPVPVRLSASITGFSYSDITQSGSDKDLLFVDGLGTQLPYEIEKWDGSGESIVWVRVPTWTSSGHIYMYYGGPAVAQNSAAVWSGYVGVWHMAEDSGTVADATGNELAAAPAGDNTAQSVATAGPIGNGRVNATDNSANRLEVSYDSALNLGNTLSFSGWVKISEKRADGRMTVVTTKKKLWENGWAVSILPDSSDDIGYWGHQNQDWGCLAALDVPDLIANWVHVTVTYNGSTGYMYINGSRWATVRQSDWTSNTWIHEAVDTENPLTFGYTANGTWDDGWSRPFKGAFDEFRLSDDVLTADRIKAEYVSQAYADAFLYEVSEVVSGTVTLADAITHSIVSADGKNTLTVTANVTSLNGDSAKVFLAVGMAEPKDGDPAALMTGVITNTVTATGDTVFVWDGAVLGTKLAYAVMNVVESGGTASTNTTSVVVETLQDPAEYFWKADETGDWSDSTKWTTSVSDGLPRLGYPSYGSRFQTRWGSRTAVIYVDAAYEGLQGGTTLGWRNDYIMFIGTVPGASIGYPETAGFGDGQYDNTHITFDGVSLTCGSFHVQHDSSLTMLNGAYLYTRWETYVRGDNASLFVGDGCELYQYGIDGNRFELSGENASIVISNGLVRANTFRIGGNADSDTDYAGKTPKGIFFLGERPQLQVLQYAKIHADMGADLPVVFTIPTNGFERTPIVKVGTTNRSFPDLNGDIPGMLFSIDEKSPYIAAKSKFVQLLVDWTYNNNSYAVNTSAITFGEMKYAPTAHMYFMPELGETKSGVAAYCYTQKGTYIIVR